jgi:hypothetical protein
MVRCFQVYAVTELFTAILFLVISISLTIAYIRLRRSINSCVFSFNKDTTDNIEILFRFLVTSFSLQTVYLIFWGVVNRTIYLDRHPRFFYGRVIAQNVTPVFFDATSILVIFLLHKNSFASRPHTEISVEFSRESCNEYSP